MNVPHAFYNCTKLPIQPYVGVYGVTGTREVFEYDHFPTDADNLPYFRIIGPFDTIQAAEMFAKRNSVR